MFGRLDDLLDHLGTGRWYYLHLAVLMYGFTLPAYHALGGAFFAPKVDYRCRDPSTETKGTSWGNDSSSQCSYMVTDNATGITTSQPCNHWDFDDSTFASTVTEEFELVCRREYLRASYTSIYMFGLFFGAPMNGFLADKYGRKSLVVVGALSFTVVALGSCFLPDFSAILVSRFLLGFFHPTTQNTGYILAIEITEPRLRSAMGIVLFLPWALGTMLWGGVAYLIREWRYLQLTVSLLCVGMLPGLWFLDESPRWLAVRGRHEEALKVLSKAARWNKVELPPKDEILTLMSQEVPQTKEQPIEKGFVSLLRRSAQGIAVLFKTPRLRLITCCMYINYIVVAMVYYGLSLSGGNVSDDPFVYMVLSGVVEIPAYTLAFPVVAKYGRRWPNAISFLVSGAALFILTALDKSSIWMVALALAGKMAISIAFQITIFYSSELFPTEVRSRGIGTCFMMSRIGSVSSPFVTEMLGTAYPWAPSAVFGAASVVAGIATLALPETRGVALPDTIAHLEERKTKDTYVCCPGRKSSK